MTPGNDLPPGVAEHFDRLAASGTWSRLYDKPDFLTYHFGVRRQRVLELLPDRLGRVADLGCGPGVMAEAVLARGGRLEGIDASPEMVRQATERFGREPGVSFRTGDVERLELPSGEYDQVVCVAVIEYLSTPDRALAEIARILRPGGMAVVTVPQKWHLDKLMVAASAPLRLLGRAFGLGRSDALPRLCLQPAALAAAARRSGLAPDGGALYYFTPIPYPFTRFTPGLAMRINLRFERLWATRSSLLGFLAHGYIGRYRKPQA